MSGKLDNIAIQGYFTGGRPRFPVTQPGSLQDNPLQKSPYQQPSVQAKKEGGKRKTLPHERMQVFRSNFPHHYSNSMSYGGATTSAPMTTSQTPVSQLKHNPLAGIQQQISNTAQAQTGGYGAPDDNGEMVINQTDNSTAYLMSRPPPRSSGQPLPPAVQAKMESLFGQDFSDVRVHVGQHVSSIGALAYTHGSNIHFAPGQYNPMTIAGQRLLGHELTHVIQQKQGKVENPFGSGVAVVMDRSLEAEADRMGAKAAASPPMIMQRPDMTPE